MTRMTISLVTLGDPNQQTGGYLYHRRIAEAAPAHDAVVSFVSLPSYSFPLTVVAGRAAMRRASDADIIVVDSIAAAFVAPRLKTTRRPIVGMLHQGPGGIDHGPLRTWSQASLDRWAYRHMRALLVASDALRHEVRDIHADVRVVAPGRDVSLRVDQEPTDMRRGRRVAFLCVANWIPRKGIIELLDAFSGLPDDAATLHLVGSTALEARYARSVRRKLDDLDDRVVVHGVLSKDRVAALYRDADAFVMPSTSEPYGTAYGEAMAQRLPVVGWDAGNLPHLAQHEREGLIVGTGDVAGLRAALMRLVDDAELRRRLGSAAHERARSFPTWAETADLFFTTLREMAVTTRRAR